MVQFKNRYMVMEIFLHSNKDFGGRDRIKITEDMIAKVIKESILLNFGECGLGISLGSLQVKYCNKETYICIIRTTRSDHQKVWSAITMIRSIGNSPASFNLLDLSGNIKCCKTAALKCEEAKFEQLKLMKGESLPSSFIESSYSRIKKLES